MATETAVVGRSSLVATSYEKARVTGVLASMLEQGFPVPLTPEEISEVGKGTHGLVDSVDLARKLVEHDKVPALCVQRQVDPSGALETLSVKDLVRPDDDHLFLAPVG